MDSDWSTYKHTHTVHMALMWYWIVFSFVTKPRPNLRISLVGYHCDIEFPCGVLLFYCCTVPPQPGQCTEVHTFVLHTTVWTYCCSGVVKKHTFFKPQPHGQKILFEAFFPFSTVFHMDSDMKHHFAVYNAHTMYVLHTFWLAPPPPPPNKDTDKIWRPPIYSR